ncbi:MAG: DUF397 domain-containing protein [Sciscionella sp.]
MVEAAGQRPVLTCVTGSEAAVRDTKNRVGGHLAVSASAWVAFLDHAK